METETVGTVTGHALERLALRRNLGIVEAAASARDLISQGTEVPYSKVEELVPVKMRARGSGYRYIMTPDGGFFVVAASSRAVVTYFDQADIPRLELSPRERRRLERWF